MQKFLLSVVASVAVAASLSSVGAVHATITTYTNETTFKSDLGAFVTHTFDVGFPVVSGFPPPGTTLDTQIPGLVFSNAVVRVGNAGGTFHTASNVVLNTDLVNPIVITFLTPVKGVGLFNTSLVDRERFSIYDGSDTLLGNMDLSENVVNFGGFISDTANITRARIVGIPPTNGSIYIDTLTVSAAPSSVPEPTSLLLLGSGLAGLAAWRRTSHS
jgi:hypothetical protein